MTWQSKLLHWYRKYRRDLPWRRTSDPYAIWVSEIMLQQTTVEAVIPYYERFLRRFPAVRDLAVATEDEVLALWSGLGYYSRARNLHKAAQRIRTVPDTIKDLMSLPGIGRYTAGAIASIAFEQRAPIVDGNVIRVLSRIFRIAVDPKSSRGQAIFWKTAEEVLPKKYFGDFNQSLMELGAMVCLPEHPLCPVCPIRSSCGAKRKGDAESFPRGRKRTVYRDVLMTAAIIRKGKKVLLVRRPGNGLLKGMWELPMVEGGVDTLIRRWPVEVLRVARPIRHSVLNRRLNITPVLCKFKADREGTPRGKWIYPSEINAIPTSSMNRKILSVVWDNPLAYT